MHEMTYVEALEVIITEEILVPVLDVVAATTKNLKGVP